MTPLVVALWEKALPPDRDAMKLTGKDIAAAGKALESQDDDSAANPDSGAEESAEELDRTQSPVVAAVASKRKGVHQVSTEASDESAPQESLAGADEGGQEQQARKKRKAGNLEKQTKATGTSLVSSAYAC